MAVFKQELNWSEYQNKQLKVLESIERSIEKSFNNFSRIENYMDKTEHAITAIVNATENSAKNMVLVTQKLTGSAIEFQSIMKTASNSINSTAKKIEDAGEEAKKSAEKSGESAADSNHKVKNAAASFAKTLLNVGDSIWDSLGGLRGIGRELDRFSAASNLMIKLSGETGSVVKVFRSSITDTVKELNSTTGGAFNAAASYERIIAISQGVTSNLEAIDEMARPLLLAQESLDVNINEVAKIFNKFYTRYSFSSASMEEILDEIRGNTAGNSANAEATIANIQALESWINYIAKDNNTERQRMLEEISHYTSWLESMNMESASYTEYIKKIAYGDTSSDVLSILSSAGLTFTEAQSMARGGQWEALTVAISKGIEGIFSTIGSSTQLGKAIDNFGMDRELAMDAHGALNSSNYVSLKEFLENVPNDITMESLVESKYVSAADKTNNWLSQIYAKLADVQESLGFGVSDIALLVALLKGNGLPNILKGMFSKGGSGSAGAPSTAGATSKALSRLGGGLYKKGAVSSTGAGLATAAGATAGLAMAGYGGFQAYQDFQNEEYLEGGLNVAGAAGGVVGAGVLLAAGASNPVGWVALALGALALVISDAVEAFTTIGAADAVEKAYEASSNSIKRASTEQSHALLGISTGLRKYNELVAEGADEVTLNNALEKSRQELINTGLLSESSIEEARTANISGLMKLTDAYLKASKQWETDSLQMINKYKATDIGYASTLHGGLEELLQTWNDSDAFENSPETLEAVEQLMYNLYEGLSKRAEQGEEFDSDTSEVYKEMKKAFKDGKLSTKDANAIIDAGFWNTGFQNANFKVEDLISSVEIMRSALVHSGVNTDDIDILMRKSGTYRGTELTTQVADVLAQISSQLDKGLITTEEAQAKLDTIKQHKNLYTEIETIADKYGLSAYAEGSNYISRDQIALLHEGESVVPKKYNPAANSAEFKYLAKELSEEREASIREAQQVRSYLSSVVSEVQEIKAFLATWKDDNTRRERIAETKSKYETSKNFVAHYMTV